MGKIMSEERYVMVTCVDTFRTRYCIPASALKTNDLKEMIEYAKDSVTCHDVTEFSQKHLGEQISDVFILDEERMLQMFDRDNDYLAGWSKEKKLEHVSRWEEDRSQAGIISPFPIEVDDDGA
jgi:hypothetical protein